MSKLESQFQQAYAVMHRKPLAKLVTPGPWKFARRYAARHGWLSGRVEADLFFGDHMTVVLPEIISEALYTYGLFDEMVTSMVLQSVRSGNVVLDIGAHFGYFSLLFSRLAGPTGRVLSFEPTPSTFDVLSSNVLNNSSIEALNLAAGDSPGLIAITDFGVQYSAWNTLAAESRLGGSGLPRPSRRFDVQLARPDDICRQRGLMPDFIKIDAENFEDHVVSGLSGVFSETRPTVLMETGSDQSLAAALMLTQMGYRLRVLNDDGILCDWSGTVEDANLRFKDVLFVANN